MKSGRGKKSSYAHLIPGFGKYNGQTEEAERGHAKVSDGRRFIAPDDPRITKIRDNALNAVGEDSPCRRK